MSFEREVSSSILLIISIVYVVCIVSVSSQVVTYECKYLVI